MSTTNPTFPTNGTPSRHEALAALCDCLLDVCEELHGTAGTDWGAEPYTPAEREVTIKAVRAVVQMMQTYGRTRDPRMFDDQWYPR